MTDLHQFWMIARAPGHPNAVTTPKQRYATEREARASAQDLANREGVTFVVLKVDQVIRPQDRSPALF